MVGRMIGFVLSSWIWGAPEGMAEQRVTLPSLHGQHECFAAQWDRNLSLQGFADAFTDAAIRG
jgi:hypothetical protein